MSETRRMTFMGREVELRVVPVGVMLDAADMINAGKPVLDAVFLTLAASAFWVEDGTRIFKDRDACRAVPGDHMRELLTLGRAAGDLNRPDFGPLAEQQEQPQAAAANGAAGAAAPSH